MFSAANDHRCHTPSAMGRAKRLFVAATGQHKGKTTSTLGIVANLQARGLDVGYCKPVGQQHVHVDGQVVDKDAVLFAATLGFDVQSERHSPVIIGSGVTAQYIEDPSQFTFEEDIVRAAQSLESQHDIVVYEGTGHTGVGSVVDLSNAQVAKLLDAPVVLVVEGGIGSTIDQLNLNLALFKEAQVAVKGVIVNKVLPSKMKPLRPILQKKFDQLGIPLVGMLPFDKALSYPIMSTVRSAVQGRILHNPDRMANRVEQTLAGSLIEIDEFDEFRNVLLVVSHTRFNEAIHKIKHKFLEMAVDECPLSGIVVTGDGRRGMLLQEDDFNDPYLNENNVPVIATRLETYDAVVLVSRIEVKINTETAWKVRRAIQLIGEHVDLDQLL